ncbi:hypothetical protein [Synechocystis sp. LKSZ1]|uniref:hypothetical protein n=1 Tax=Synechocystis sp. LKSZ1 TaxID=3144951 RepID=UPI00336C17B9
MNRLSKVLVLSSLAGVVGFGSLVLPALAETKTPPKLTQQQCLAQKGTWNQAKQTCTLPTKK